jgi:hypothetical protein
MATINMSTEFPYPTMEKYFSFNASGLYTATGRIDYDYFNSAVNFNYNARFPDEPASVMVELPHDWIEGTPIKPHIHWLQEQSDIPNFILAYKIAKNGELYTKEANFNNHTKTVCGTPMYTWVSNGLQQTCPFPDISTVGMSISDKILVTVFRDSTNASGLFAGVDPVATDVIAWDFGVHYLSDGTGSKETYVK